jgi:predicted transcriptional regulator
MVDAGVEDMLYPLDPADETKSLSFFGLMAAKDRFVLAVTDKQRLGKIKDVPVKFDEESKVLAKVSLRSIYWTADRKLLVAVVTQRIDTGSFVSESDQLHVVRFDPKAIQWVDPTPDPPAAK